MKSTIQLILSISFLLAFTSTYSQKSEKKSVSVDGKKISYQTFNLDNRKEGEPILVFETGLGGGTFDPLLPFFPSTMSGIQYERSGFGQSELDINITTDAQLIERLHRLLKALHIQPPYLLVGHSIGGPYIRLFAATYPDEVCGLVFIDPTDFMLTSAENEEARIKSESLTGYQEVSLIVQKMMSENKDFGSGPRNDASRAFKVNASGYFQEYQNLPQLNSNIATTVIISYNKHIEQPDEDLNRNQKLGINFKSWWKEYDKLRIQHYADMIKDNDNSMIILLPKYSHGLYYQDPELVAKLIIENYNNNIK